MNRADRRKLIKENPKYRKILKSTTEKAVEDLENTFKKRWEKENSTKNETNKN